MTTSNSDIDIQPPNPQDLVQEMLRSEELDESRKSLHKAYTLKRSVTDKNSRMSVVS